MGTVPTPTTYWMDNYGSKGWLLYLAACGANLSTFRLLQDRGASLQYSLALHGAAHSGASQLPILRHLLQQGSLDIDELDVYTGMFYGTPLFQAVTSKNEEAVRLLFEYGADPEAKLDQRNESIIERAKSMAKETGLDVSKRILEMIQRAVDSRRQIKGEEAASHQSRLLPPSRHGAASLVNETNAGPSGYRSARWNRRKRRSRRSRRSRRKRQFREARSDRASM